MPAGNAFDIESIDFCPVCEKRGELLTELKNYPITEIYKRPHQVYEGVTHADQELRMCACCHHLFLGKRLPKEYIYTNYNTISAASEGSRLALNNFYNFVCQHASLSDVASIVDVGANDCTLLEKFISHGAALIGIDPNVKSQNEKISCINDYIENVDLSDHCKGKTVFLSSHTIEHIYDVRGFVKNLANSMKNDDFLFLQFPSCELLMKDFRFDQVHHQHLNYFSLTSIDRLLETAGLRIVAHQFDPSHYGALMCYIRKGERDEKPQESISLTPEKFAAYYKNYVDQMAISDFVLSSWCDSGDGFYCYGASLMLPILQYYMPTMDKATAVIDQDTKKHGLVYINYDCIITGEENIEFSDKNILVTAVSTKSAGRSIISNLIRKNTKNIIFPLAFF